ncbi:hypothetical protein D7V18_09650 [Stenotrophomonas maltophilia]|nr:hypothetical protein [Stenotrophomonas maltophilia]
MAWIYRLDQGRHLPTAIGICQRWGGVGVRGVSRMGPRHASAGLGRTPNPAFAVAVEVAGQRPALPRVQGRRPCRTTP